jgi:hypothetical protein
VWGEDASNVAVIPVQNLDVKPGLVPVLVPGIQDFKNPGSLEQVFPQSFRRIFNEGKVFFGRTSSRSSQG